MNNPNNKEKLISIEDLNKKLDAFNRLTRESSTRKMTESESKAYDLAMSNIKILLDTLLREP
jgi:hypothetical protein